MDNIGFLQQFVIDIIYLAASALFILGLKGLTKAPTARRGMNMAAVGMTLATIDTGRFAGYLQLPVRGNWDLDVVVEHGGDRFAQTRRLFLK